MDGNKRKLNDIQNVYERWSGLFIKSDAAMYQISQILKSEYLSVENVIVSDMNGNEIGKFDNVTFKIDK